MQIEPYASHHRDAIVSLSLRAWTPVFDSIENVMEIDVYQAFYPNSWRVSQQKAVMGEIYMIAVEPDFQGRGIGTTLIEFALTQMKDAGMSIAMVDTGGDDGHAPARHTYEKVGFGLLPIARYFKKL